MSTLLGNPDYSEEFEDKPLLFKLYDKYDDERDLWIKSRLESLVNGSLTPNQLAIDVDTRITEDTNRKHDELMKWPSARNNLTEEEESDEYRIVPHPNYHISPLFSAIAWLSTAFPAYHSGQSRIVEFLLALQSLPRHEIYVGLPPEDPSEPYRTVALWPFEEEDGWWQMFSIYFQEVLKLWLAPYRSRNLNSTMARLTILKLCNCASLSALWDILPSNNEYPDLEKRPIDGPNKLGNNLIAAAQWILTPEAGRFVYRECRKELERSEPEWKRESRSWSMAHWREWKRQFAFVAGDERFAVKYREVAERSHRQMVVYEEDNK